MVEYEEWTGIATQVAEEKYGRPTFDQHGDNVKRFAEVWNRRKAELKAASTSEAVEIANEEL